MTASRLGILVFVLAVLAGPLLTAPGYSPVANLISELAAQNTPHRWLMVAGFLALGAGLLWDARRHLRGPGAAVAAFGLFLGLAGLFGHKPITPGVPYNPTWHEVHGLLGTLSGIAITVAFGWQAWRESTARPRAIAAVLCVLGLALPLAMLALPAWQGLIQRAMYALFLAWLWVHAPGRLIGPGPPRARA